MFKAVLDRRTTKKVNVVIVTNGAENSSQNVTSKSASQIVDNIRERGYNVTFMNVNDDYLGTVSGRKSFTYETGEDGLDIFVSNRSCYRSFCNRYHLPLLYRYSFYEYPLYSYRIVC